MTYCFDLNLKVAPKPLEGAATDAANDSSNGFAIQTNSTVTFCPFSRLTTQSEQHLRKLLNMNKNSAADNSEINGLKEQLRTLCHLVVSNINDCDNTLALARAINDVRSVHSNLLAFRRSSDVVPTCDAKTAEPMRSKSSTTAKRKDLQPSNVNPHEAQTVLKILSDILPTAHGGNTLTNTIVA